MLMVGPPGSGKSMLAARLPSILPALEPRELLEVSMIASIAGDLTGGQLSDRRPFREPHHSASMAAMAFDGAVRIPTASSAAICRARICGSSSVPVTEATTAGPSAGRPAPRRRPGCGRSSAGGHSPSWRRNRRRQRGRQNDKPVRGQDGAEYGSPHPARSGCHVPAPRRIGNPPSSRFRARLQP